MLKKRIIFILTTFIMMIALSIMMDNTVLAGIITFIVMISGYIIVSYTRSRKRLSLLEEQCDPELFMEATEKQRAITGKNPKFDSYLSIDKAAGLILSGEIQTAKEVLLSINKSYLSYRNGTLLVYTINLITCLYELGETEYAEELFENEISLLSPINKRMRMAVKLLIAERYYYLKDYEKSREKFKQLLKEKLTKRVRLSIIFSLAQIDEKTGNLVSAKEKYKEVSENANKLWIAKQAQEYLKNF